MILLYSGVNEEVIITLLDSITLTNPEYVIVFVHDDTNKKAACKLGTDMSSYPERASKFQITVKSSPNALNAEVDLINYGHYKYYVFEKEDADTFDFSGVDSMNISDIQGEVKRGKMEYLTTATEVPSYKDYPGSMKAYA